MILRNFQFPKCLIMVPYPLEEKFRAPGLVAQKKAYFEEHHKRIRAMKALEENQHVEPASCCGGGSGKSEQTREEDLRAVPNESHGGEMENNVGSGIEKASSETNLVVDGESALVESDSPAKSSKDNKKGENSRNSMQWQLLDLNSHDDKHVDSEHDDFITLDNDQEPWGRRLDSTSRQTREENHRAVSNETDRVELKNNIGACTERASTEVTFEIGGETALLGTDSPTTSSNDCKKDENRQNSLDHECLTNIKDSSPNIFEIMLEVEQKKAKPVVKECKKSALTFKVMDHSFQAGGFCKLEYKTEPFTFMSTQAVRDPSQKRNGKNNERELLLSQVVLHQDLLPKIYYLHHHVILRITIQRLLQVKRAFHIVRRARNWGHEEVGRKGFAFNRHDTHQKAGGASNVIRPVKTRSFDLPNGHKGDAKDGTNSNRLRSNNGDGRHKLVEVASNETCLKEAGGHGKPAIVHSLCRNQNSENIKMASSRIRDLSLNTKKSCLGGGHYLVKRKAYLMFNPCFC